MKRKLFVGVTLKLLALVSSSVLNPILTPLPGLLRVPQSLHGSPPLNSECLTFDLYGNATSMHSSLYEDFQLVENLAVVKLHNHCDFHLDHDKQESSYQSINGSANSKKRHICVQTELTPEHEFGCDNETTKYRFSVLICDKWWRSENEKDNTSTEEPSVPNPLSSTPAESPLIWGGLDHLPIEALCVLLPKKPWCHPRLVCNWFPNMGRCKSRKTIASSQTVSDRPMRREQEDLTNNYFIVGILRDFEHHKTCTTFVKKSEPRLKLYQTYVRVGDQASAVAS